MHIVMSMSDHKDFLEELKEQAKSAESRADDKETTYVDQSDGTVYEWDPEKRGWFPKVDDDFIAAYQMNYGFAAEGEDESTDNKEIAVPVIDAAQTTNSQIQKQDEQAIELKKKKRKVDEGWFEVDDNKNPNVYVSGLPLDTTDEEFIELMSKYGIIMQDPDTGKPKIKLYRDTNGQLKGDGRCCYLKRESVDLAIKLLDESDYKGYIVHVEQAEFHQKGEYNPSLKKKKKNKKKKAGKGQEKLLDWIDRDTRKKQDRIIVFKNVFNVEDFEKNPVLITELRDDIKRECEKFGEVRKVIVFDRNKEGICSVAFTTFEAADACLPVMNGRWFGGRRISAERWDGVTNYKVVETELQREERLNEWEKYLAGELDEPTSSKH
ncbi:17S U2 SnRNP complex component HTATSF1-like [Montipora capricornis]|uniref:17S U2 SnRNP complex component HTATSF1-like n=1 Tax=Montipora capricornis TaxID=246305 RepID=UPI0035F13C07